MQAGCKGFKIYNRKKIPKPSVYCEKVNNLKNNPSVHLKRKKKSMFLCLHSHSVSEKKRENKRDG